MPIKLYDREGAFGRRKREDGNLESICMACYQSAAKASDEETLKALEKTHVCYKTADC